jgi:chromosome segregation ATPase
MKVKNAHEGENSMQEKADDLNFVEELRLKTEESDLDQQLKTRFGGYTKQSVLDYLNNLRKNQQMTADTFKTNLQTLYNEKETLSKNYDALQQKYEKIAAENQELKSGHGELEAKSILQESELMGLKEQLEPLVEENRRMAENSQRLVDQLNVAKQETVAAKEMLAAQTGEVRRLEDKTAELIRLVETKQDEIQYYIALEAEGGKAALSAKINELTEQLAAQTEILSRLNSQMAYKEQAIGVLTESNESQKQKILELMKTLEAGQLQNEKLSFANEALSRQMQEEYEKNLALIKSKSDLAVERLVIQRKLDEATSRIAMLELVNKKSAGLQDANRNASEEGRSS